MEIETVEERKNLLLKRKEITFKLKHEEGASPSREEARKALIKALKCSPNLLVVDNMKTEYGKRETVGYAKVYESEERLNEVEREHIIKRNFERIREGSAKGEE